MHVYSCIWQGLATEMVECKKVLGADIFLKACQFGFGFRVWVLQFKASGLGVIGF